MLTLTSPVKDGKLSEQAAGRIKTLLQGMEGRKVVVTIKEWKKKRSLSQNAYWFGMLNKYVVPKFREAGADWDDYNVHCLIMKELGYQKMLPDPNGQMHTVRDESSKFTTQEWEDFMERARALLGLQFDIFLPLPNEVEYDEVYRFDR